MFIMIDFSILVAKSFYM